MSTIPWYCTREDVKGALDSKETARNNAQIDRAIDSASRSIESMLNRVFYPSLATKYFDWPNNQDGRAYRLWLDEQEVISITTLTSGGTVIPAASYNLEPVNVGPPYSHIEVKLSSTSAFSTGSTHQQTIVVTGLFGYDNNYTSAGTANGALNSSTTAVSVTDSYLIGIGSLIKVDSEIMVVTNKQMLTTSQVLGGAGLAASNSDVTVPVSNGTLFAVGEVILLDSEKMLIVEISANNLSVKRAWDGSVLAAHTAATTIYAPRTLVVERGSLGTTAASHLTAAPISVYKVPGPVKALCIAEALNTLQQESSGYARDAGQGGSSKSNQIDGLQGKRNEVYASHGRKFRQRVV